MMRDTIPGDELLRKAHAIGQYYGFVPFATLSAGTRGEKKDRSQKTLDMLAGLTLDPVAEAVASFLKQCESAAVVPSPRHPLFIWHTNVTAGRPAPKKALVQFHAIGADRAIADAVVIRALAALVEDLYHTRPVVRINSMGDKETRARYARELGSFFKKRAASLPEECVACAREDAIGAAELAIERACAEDLPAPTDHLSDASRKRFEDLLEYLETTGTPYELARDLVSRGSAWSETCFELKVDDKRVAWGSRYSDLARHFFPVATPAMVGVLQAPSGGGIVTKPSNMKVRFAFVHIGDEAKHCAIQLVEELKRARVPVAQDIGIESLTEQLLLAEKRNPSHLVIMGRKEALEGSAILRDRSTQEETIIPLGSLVEELKATV